MGTRTEHAPGTFSWVDLTTSDTAAAKHFYGTLLGWGFEDNDLSGGGTYTMCTVGGEYVSAIPPATDQFPPHWTATSRSRTPTRHRRGRASSAPPCSSSRSTSASPAGWLS